MAEKIFTCTTCGVKFETEWTDKEAEEELKTNFPNLDSEDCEIVCTECYDKIRNAFYG